MLTLTRFLRDVRGQALVESTLFIPLMLTAVLALIFFCRFGVLGERGESAVRYANFVAFRNGQSYTMATVYDLLDEILNPTANQLGPLCLTPNSLTPNPNNTPAQAALQALTQQQPAVSATAVPATKGFWTPDSEGAPACNPLSVQLTSGTYGVADLPLSVTSFQVTSTVNMSKYLSQAIHSNQTTSSMAFLNVATPNLLVACVPALTVALTVLSDLTYNNTPTCPTTSNQVSF
jgi:hypothetical protein